MNNKKLEKKLFKDVTSARPRKRANYLEFDIPGDFKIFATLLGRLAPYFCFHLGSPDFNVNYSTFNPANVNINESVRFQSFNVTRYNVQILPIHLYTYTYSKIYFLLSLRVKEAMCLYQKFEVEIPILSSEIPLEKVLF